MKYRVGWFDTQRHVPPPSYQKKTIGVRWFKWQGRTRGINDQQSDNKQTAKANGPDNKEKKIIRREFCDIKRSLYSIFDQLDTMINALGKISKRHKLTNNYKTIIKKALGNFMSLKDQQKKLHIFKHFDCLGRNNKPHQSHNKQHIEKKVTEDIKGEEEEESEEDEEEEEEDEE